MSTGFVLEVVVDPLLLEEPGDEVEVALVVLHAVLAWLVGAPHQVELDIRVALLLEYLAHDVGHGEVLEDPAIAGEGEKPEPGNDLGLVRRQSFLLAGLHEPPDPSVDDALPATPHLERHAGRSA